MKGRLSITEVAKTLGVTPRTIMRWEKANKIKKSKRDWRGWRFYTSEDVDDIRNFYESAYEYNETEGSFINTVKGALIVFITMTGLLTYILCGPGLASSVASANNADSTAGVEVTGQSVDIILGELPVRKGTDGPIVESVKYTLGPDDVIAIEVKRHPEFSGEYKVNSEGKIEYKYVGDIIVNGLSKKECKERIEEVLSEYLIEPIIDVQIVAYLSKVFYVVGDVGRPGKFYMRGDTITVREALVQSGLPTNAAAMRRCRLITPDKTGKQNFVEVNVFSLLYEGNLKQNITMKPGEVLYIPSTIMAKIIRVIRPVTDTAARAAGAVISGASIAAIAL